MLRTNSSTQQQHFCASKFELEKLKVDLTWKPDLEKIAQDDRGQNGPSNGQDGMLAASNNGPQGTNGAIPMGVASRDDDFVNIGVQQTSSNEKNCSACTMLNPFSAYVCMVCGGTDFDT